MKYDRVFNYNLSKGVFKLLHNLEDKNPQVLKEIANLWLEVNIEVHDFVNENYWKTNYDEVVSAFRDAELLIYKEQNEIVGFCGTVDNYIAGIFIKKGFRSQGIGQKFISHLKNKHQQLTLSVYAQNTEALRFYQAVDFSIIAEQFDEMNHLEYVMTWDK